MNLQIQIRTECSICKGEKTNGFSEMDMYMRPCEECAGEGYNYKWIDTNLLMDQWDNVSKVCLFPIPNEIPHICPSCKTDLVIDKSLVLSSNPPKYRAHCPSCNQYVKYIPVSEFIPDSMNMKIHPLPD